MQNARQIAFLTLRDIDRRDSYTDIALDRALKNTDLKRSDRALVTELVYGIVRRQRTLDTLIEQLSQKPIAKQPPDLRRILQIGLYQLRYLDHIPDSAAVNTSVDLAKNNGLKGLSGVVNGILRQYIRLGYEQSDPLILPKNPVQRLGILHSFPDWMMELFLNQFGEKEAELLCDYLNQPPTIDLRVNPLKANLEIVETAFAQQQVETARIPGLPQALRLIKAHCPIQQLPGFTEGWWTVQDASAQLVSILLDPQPNELIIDACAAPGGKTTHIAELMGDQGTIWACDRTVSRLKKLTKTVERLELQSIQTVVGDSRDFPQFINSSDRVLVDAPCSGLGTLHRNPDIRWRQTPDKIEELTQLQAELLTQAAFWVKPQGILVYSTCTLNIRENQEIIEAFLTQHPNWRICDPALDSFQEFSWNPERGIQILPHQQKMDGFFMIKLQKN
ncbi:MAG: 16S rRNA (cytosine(967)-C(5))-methyltransferase [Snowella sp.]|nr:16S rRNA (cytosine(967)-C(5))-methyltransferase [Snowella sp.]